MVTLPRMGYVSGLQGAREHLALIEDKPLRPSRSPDMVLRTNEIFLQNDGALRNALASQEGWERCAAF